MAPELIENDRVHCEPLSRIIRFYWVDRFLEYGSVTIPRQLLASFRNAIAVNP